VDRPKDWYKTMFKQIHMVHKAGVYDGVSGRIIEHILEFSFKLTNTYRISAFLT